MRMTEGQLWPLSQQTARWWPCQEEAAGAAGSSSRMPRGRLVRDVIGVRPVHVLRESDSLR